MTAVLKPRPKYERYESIDEIPEEELPSITLPPALQKLSDDEATLAAILMDRSGIDLVEMIFVDEQRPTRCYRVMPYQWTWWRCMDDLQIDQGARCVQVGTKVLTSTGWKAIESVAVGELVLTHQNRWRRVLGSFDRGVRPAVEVSGHGPHRALVTTPDHRFWARHASRASLPRDGHKGKKLAPPEWVRADEFRSDDRSQVMGTNWSSPSEVEALPLPAQLVGAYRSGQQNHPVALWCEDWMWLYGLFVAEGSTFINATYGRATWSVHDDEVAKVTGTLERLGLNYHLDGSCEGAATTIVVNSRPTAQWLREHAGHGAASKKLAPWVYGLPIELRQAVFDGLTFGDGHTRPDGRIDYTTVSEDLIFGLKLLAQGLGWTCSAHVARQAGHQGMINGRAITCREAYGASLQRLDDQRHPHVKIEQGHAWSAVKSITPVDAVAMWDLEVEEDHSFVASGVVVHNSCGKSESIIAQASAFPYNFPGQEFVIVTPEGSHADALTERFEMRLFASRLMQEMLAGGRRSGVTHHPFQALFENGSRIFVRLPQRSGIGVKGIHPVVLHIDEAQDVSERTWNELPEVVRKEVEGHQTRAHGVSKGVQDDSFAKKTLPDSGWTVHRITKLHRPDLRPYTFVRPDGTLDAFTTNETEVAQRYARENGYVLQENWREMQAREYGGRESPDFKRNVYGVHGDAMNRIFVLTRLMAGVDTNESSDYNLEEYHRFEIKSDQVAIRAESRSGRAHDIEVYDDEQANALVEMVDLPRDHLENYKVFWCGMDVGVIGDPSEIVVLGEYVPKGAQRTRDANAKLKLPNTGVSQFKLLTRIHLHNMAPDLQAHLIMHVINHYGPRAFSLDRTGNGIGILRALQRLAGTARTYVLPEAENPESADLASRVKARDALTAIKGYNFSEKVIIEIDERIVEERGLTDPKKILTEAGVRQNVKDAATDVLRELVDAGRLRLPYDSDVINQMNGQTWQMAQEPVDQYGRSRRNYSRGDFHILDAMRMFALGMDKQPIEELVAATRAAPAPVLDRIG